MSLRGKSVRRVPSPHPLREGAERIEIYLKAPRHPANHNSDAWDSGDEAKTLDCNILKRLSLPTEALAAALCKTMKYCVFLVPRFVTDTRVARTSNKGEQQWDSLKAWIMLAA